MSRLKVVVHQNRLLFYRALLALLRQEGDLEVVEGGPAADLPLEELCRLNPQALVILTAGDVGSFRPPLPQLFEALPQTQVIVMTQVDNALRCYSSQRLELAQCQPPLPVLRRLLDRGSNPFPPPQHPLV